MGVAGWLTWLALSGGALALIGWHYTRRETPGRGRLLLAALRGVALAVLLLLLFDPDLPARGVPARGTQVLLDASLSMTFPAANRTGSRWDEAVGLARSTAAGRSVILFGDRPRSVAPGSLPAEAPGDGRSLLLPALQAAAEAGVRRVVVITDGAVEELAAAAAWAPRLGLEIAPRTVGEGIANRSMIEATAPSWVEAGRPFSVEFGVTAPPSDSIRVVARSDGRVLGRTAVAAPAEGRVATGAFELRLDAPPGGGWTRIELALEGADAVPDDDRRTVYVHVTAEPSGIVLVSFQPDWEPRFLTPVLEQAVGLPLRAYLRGAAGQYVRLAGGLEAGLAVSEADVRGVVERADLVVLHGIGADAPAWATTALGTARGVLVFPAPGGADLPLPLEIGAAEPGDWFLTAEIPPSPLAPLLAGQEMGGIAPLASLRTAASPSGAWTPLVATRGRQGTPQPVLIAGTTSGRRWAVALGSGFWQWSFRGGTERQLYSRLWSALAGWLARERAAVTLPAVRPVRLATPRGLPVAWVAPGLAADSVGIRIVTSDETVVIDTVVTRIAGDTAFTAVPPPGDYSYRARAFAGDTVTAAAGPLTVETYSPEFTRPTADLSVLRGRPAAVRDVAGPRAGVPLHATAYPYVLLILLLAAEWILRRRWGLR